MIKTLSPYYVTTPFTYIGPLVCTAYTLKIYIWTGSKISDVPTDATYEITINNAAQSNGNSKVNISRLINSYLEFTPVTLGSTSLVNSDNQMWIRTVVYYFGNSGVFINSPFHIDTQIALKGYGFGLDGENPDTPDNKVLMRVGDYTMSESGTFIVPIELDESPAGAAFIIINNITQTGSTLDAAIDFTVAGTYEEFYILAEFVSSGVIALISVPGTTSTQPITFPALGEWNVIMYGYDSESNSTPESNTFNITLT